LLRNISRKTVRTSDQRTCYDTTTALQPTARTGCKAPV